MPYFGVHSLNYRDQIIELYEYLETVTVTFQQERDAMLIIL